MATNIRTVQTATGPVAMRRDKPQGRPPQGLRMWKGRIRAESLAAIEAEAARLAPYYSVNQIIRDAIDRYVGTELLKH